MIIPSKRRSSLEIVYVMLSYLSRGPSRMTKLMAKANLSHARLYIYLKALNKKGYISIEYLEVCADGDRPTVVRIQDKGRRFLENYARFIQEQTELIEVLPA